MHLSSHNWMRAEKLETTLRRMKRLGYASIEISGEPEQYDVAETRRHDEAGAGIDQRNTNDSIHGTKLMRLHAEGRFEQHPGAPIEELEKASVEDDSGGIAVSPLDGELPLAVKLGHQRHECSNGRNRSTATDAFDIPAIMTAHES